MKKVKTKVVASCVVLSNSKIPIDKLLEACSPVHFGGAWAHLSMKSIYSIQEQALKPLINVSAGNALPIKIQNAFIIQTGRLMGKKTSQIVLHLQLERGDFAKIKGKYLIPRLCIQERPVPGKKKMELITELFRFDVCKEQVDPLTSSPVILGEQVVSEED